MTRLCNKWCPLRPGNAPRLGPSESIQLQTYGSLDQAEVASRLYRPIKEWQTRLVVLRDGALGSDLIADLVTVDLLVRHAVIHDTQQKTEFTALSYTWGAPVFSQRLIVNDLPYSITENLYLFLRRCRQLTDIRTLWIDAVCINQHDNVEKSVQVSNMLNVYKSASAVIVWLGEAEHNSDLAIDYLRWTKGRGFMHSAGCVNKIEVREALRYLCDRPWMHRIWIRQEVWAARSIQVMCGTNSITWEQLTVDLYDILRNLDDQDEARSGAIASGMKMNRRKFGELAEQRDDESAAPYIGVLRHDIVTAMNRSFHCQCTNERDRIYGLLGMTTVNVIPGSAADADRPQLRVDYNLTVEEVFEDVARYVMRRESSVSSVLCLQARFGGNGLPSWVPNWRYRTSYEPYLYFEMSIRGKPITTDASDDDVEKGKDPVFQNLSSESRVAISSWNGPLQSTDGLLHLRGYAIAAVTTQATCDTYLEIRLAYRDKANSTRQFKSATGFEDEDDPVNVILNHLLTATEEVKNKYKDELESKGSVHLGLLRKGRKKPFVLRREDVTIEEHSRSVLPVSNGDNNESRFARYQDDDAWNNMKPMHIDQIRDHMVSFEEVSGSRLFSRYSEADLKAEQKCSRRAQRLQQKSALTKKAQRTAKIKTLQDAKNVALFAKRHNRLEKASKQMRKQDVSEWSTEEEDEDRGSWEDEVEDEDDDSDNEDDSDSHSDSDTDESADEEDESDSTSDTDDDEDMDMSELDEDDYSLDPDDSYLYYSVRQLNDLYNKHFPQELAVPHSAQTDDIIVVTEGSALPFVLRPVSNGVSGESPKFTFVGPALLNYRSVATNPDAPKKYEYLLDQFTRPQMSIYQHFQLLLQSKLRNGEVETFNIT